MGAATGRRQRRRQAPAAPPLVGQGGSQSRLRRNAEFRRGPVCMPRSSCAQDCVEACLVYLGLRVGHGEGVRRRYHRADERTASPPVASRTPFCPSAVAAQRHRHLFQCASQDHQVGAVTPQLLETAARHPACCSYSTLKVVPTRVGKSLFGNVTLTWCESDAAEHRRHARTAIRFLRVRGRASTAKTNRLPKHIGSARKPNGREIAGPNSCRACRRTCGAVHRNGPAARAATLQKTARPQPASE
jgi:hypothetical protein